MITSITNDLFFATLLFNYSDYKELYNIIVLIILSIIFSYRFE